MEHTVQFRDYTTTFQDQAASAYSIMNDSFVLDGFDLLDETSQDTILSAGVAFIKGYVITATGTQTISTLGKYIIMELYQVRGTTSGTALNPIYSPGSVTVSYLTDRESIPIDQPSRKYYPLYEWDGTKWQRLFNYRLDAINNLKADSEGNLTLDATNINVTNPTTSSQDTIEQTVIDLNEKINILTSVDLSAYSTTAQSDIRYVNSNGDNMSGDYNLSGTFNVEGSISLMGDLDVNTGKIYNSLANTPVLIDDALDVTGETDIKGLLRLSNNRVSPIDIMIRASSAQSLVRQTDTSNNTLARYLLDRTDSTSWVSYLTMNNSAGTIKNGLRMETGKDLYNYGTGASVSSLQLVKQQNIELLEVIQTLDQRVTQLEGPTAVRIGVNIQTLVDAAKESLRQTVIEDEIIQLTDNVKLLEEKPTTKARSSEIERMIKRIEMLEESRVAIA